MAEEEKKPEEESSEEESKEDSSNTQESNLDRAERLNNELKESIKVNAEILKKIEDDKAEKILSGKADAGHIPKMKVEETPQEYAKRVMANEV